MAKDIGPGYEGTQELTWEQVVNLARKLNPTLDERVTALEDRVEALALVHFRDLREVCAGESVDADDDIVFLTPFGIVQRRNGAWVNVTNKEHPDSQRVSL